MVTKKDLLKYKTLMVKSNYIIEASYKLNLQEQRLIYILTTKINKDDTDFKNYRFTQTEVNSILSKHKISFNELSQHIDSLRNRELVIIKENSILKIKWLSSAEYFNDGSIELCFDDKLKPYLLQLKDRFTKLNLDKIVSFNSNYSCRIYELLKQYEKIGERTMTIEALRTMFCIQPEEYSRYNDFKRKVILQAHKELSKSDISFDFEELKEVRKVTSIRFIIKSNSKAINEIAVTGIMETDLKETAIIKQVQEIFYKHSITELEASKILEASKNNIELIKAKYFIVSNMQGIKNIVGATIQAIKEDWQQQKQNTNSTFNNFKQREYDFDDLKKKLLGWS